MKKYLFVSLFALFASFQSKAHIYNGGEITWECLANGQYIFKMNLYAECQYHTMQYINQTISYPGGNIVVKPDSNLWLSLNQGNISHQGINGCQLSCDIMSPQLGAFSFWPFVSDPVSLNGVPPPGGWVFKWAICCRSDLENLSAPLSKNVTLRSIMYPYKGQSTSNCYDSSPKFAEFPVFAVCDDMPFSYNSGAYDKDLDSLIYKWAKPWDVSNAPVVFKSGYSFENPTPDSSFNPLNQAATLDSVTGTMQFTVYGAQNYFMYAKCIRVDSYREGVKIASVFRDVPIMPMDCSDLPNSNLQNNAPHMEVNGVPETKYIDTVIAGEKITLPIQIIENDLIYDPNNPMNIHLQKVALSPDGFLFSNNFKDSLNCQTSSIAPCATLSPAPLLNPQNGELELVNQGTVSTLFEWQTDCAHLGPSTGKRSNYKTYNFILKSYDAHCLIPGLTFPSLSFVVARYKPIIRQNGNILYVDPAQSYQWYYNGNPIPNSDTNRITIAALGMYSIEVVKYGCPSQMSEYQVVFVSLDEVDWNNAIKVYPNPFKEGFTVEFPKVYNNEYRIELMDINGRQLKFNLHEKQNILQLSNNSLPSGIYFIKLVMEGKTVLRKIVKK